MSHALSESSVLASVARLAALRLTRKVIADLQRMQVTLSGEDSGLMTTWDEVCVQVQHEESYSWEAYEESVRALVNHYVDSLPAHEREALWLQTDAGSEWLDEEPNTRDRYPVFADDVAQLVMTDYVYREAGRWSNARIRAFIDRSGARD